MRSDSSQYVSGWKTADDWATAKERLTANPSVNDWSQVFKDFFETRLALRYLQPIQLLQEHGTLQGEGFSIAAIQCSLIEFLESTLQGVTYHCLRKGETLKPYEYSSSSELFRNFLTTRAPFAAQFTNEVAVDFYVNVRCALLHEASTKGDWRIWAGNCGGKIIDATQKIFYRNNFQDALLKFVADYGGALPVNLDYQTAFIRKFDDLCQ
ncbi:MAG: hypothetical protein WAM70_04135 [Pyrinomonadaceae bacterium]